MVAGQLHTAFEEVGIIKADLMKEKRLTNGRSHKASTSTSCVGSSGYIKDRKRKRVAISTSLPGDLQEHVISPTSNAFYMK